MIVNEIALHLIRESLMDQKLGVIARPVSVDTWRSVYKELKSHAVLGLVSDAVLKQNEVPDEIRKEWRNERCNYLWKHCQIAYIQSEVCDLLVKSNINVAVMKGMAAAMYYPASVVRGMGDIDLIVNPVDYKKAIRILDESGYNIVGSTEGRYHTKFIINNIEIELHRSPSGIHRDLKGEKIREYILSGLDSVENGQLRDKKFPVLPWKQNGMELIWHIRQHLYNGLGLRQIIDWMMFVNNMLDDEHMKEYLPDLECCGLDQLAITVTKMCQKYLGLTHEKITWCDSAEEDLCDSLMEFVFEQGDFGKKTLGEKSAKVFSAYLDPRLFLTRLQIIGESKWKLLKRYPMFTPLAFIYGGVNELRNYLKRDKEIKSSIYNICQGLKRAKLFSRIYSSEKKRKYSICFMHTIRENINIAYNNCREKCFGENLKEKTRIKSKKRTNEEERRNI